MNPIVERLGSALLHFLWQGFAIACVYAVLRRRWENAGADARYLLGCVAPSAMAVAPIVTWCVLSPSGSVAASVGSPRVSSMAAGEVHRLQVVFAIGGFAPQSTPFLSWVVAIWLAGASILCARLLGGWILAMRLRSRLVHPASTAWQQTLDRLKDRMLVIRPVRLLVSSVVQAPMVVGWLRPVVLVPIGALAGLPPEQVEALLLHELAHIRRCDYLVNILQSAIEALLFYHPAVWWVSSHIRAERELCCDDAAVSAMGDPFVYARALAELGTLCPPVVMAANRGSLVDRIGRLMGKPPSPSRTPSGTGIAATAVLLIVAAAAVFGQSTARPEFQAVSIRPSTDSGLLTQLRSLPNGIRANTSLQMLIRKAYGVQPFQIEGGPEWISTHLYEVEAKANGTPGTDQINLMMQSMLEDRFHLKVHREMRELPTYNLVIAKGGPKLPAAKGGACDKSVDPLPEPNGGRMDLPVNAPDGVPINRPGANARPGACGILSLSLQLSGARMGGSQIATLEIARMLSVLLGRSVMDKTGLTGLFDVQLNFQPDESTAPLPPPPPNAPASETMNPPIFNALQEQLGLRLESGRGPVGIIVIDHVEEPSAN